MAGSGQALTLKVNVSADGLVSGLQVASKTLDGFASSTRTSFGGLGTSSKEASKHVEGFGAVLKEFKSEQVQQARTARFFANEITSIIPATGGASSALKGFLGVAVEGLSGGGAVLVGFELAKFALEQLTETITENEKEAAKLRGVYADTAASISKSLKGVRDSLEPITDTMKAWRAEEDKVRENARKTAQEAGNYYHSWASTFQDLAHLATLGFADSSEEKIKKMMRSVSVERKALKDKEEERDRTAEDEGLHRHEKFLREEIGLEAATKDQIAKLRADLKTKIEEINRESLLSEEDKKARILVLERNMAEEIRRIRVAAEFSYRAAALGFESAFLDEKVRLHKESELRIARAEEEARQNPSRKNAIAAQIAEDRFYTDARIRQIDEEREAQFREVMVGLQLDQFNADEKTRIYTEASLKIQRIQEKLAHTSDPAERSRLQAEIDQLIATADAKAIASEKKKLTELRQTYDAYGQAAGRVLLELASGHRTLGNVVETVAHQSAIALIDAAEKAVEAYALQAMAAAIAANAAIPFIGIALGVAAAATVGGLIKGLLSEMPSARGGMDIPSGVNPQVQLHQREMVLPEKQADVIRRMADGGPGGGFGATGQIIINAMDGASVQRVVESPAFRRAIREAQRNGDRP